MSSGDFSSTTEPNFDRMKVLELKQYLQVRGISVTAKRREELLTFLFVIPMGGFHVTSSPPCWWTKTIDLSLAPFVRPPAFVHFTIVICVSRDWLKTTYTIYVFLSHDQFAFWLLHIELHRFRLHTVLAKY